MTRRYLGKYKDVLLFLVMIPHINTINYHFTYARIRWDWYTVATYLIDLDAFFTTYLNDPVL